jgi:ubiquinone/menaquinone biosynthesis C-methylase UbiE
MTTPDYDYHGLIASTWDLWRDNTADWSDRHFYLGIIRKYGQPALDIGCGTGRLVLDYLQEGIDVDGVDNSPEMLAICRAKADKMNLSPNLYEQSMETLDLPRTYRTIVAPSSALQLLTDKAEARAALGRFFAHLQPGGAFVTPFFFDWQEGEPLDTGFELLFEKTRPEDGALVRSWVREWREPDKQWWHTEQRFEVELNGNIMAREEQRRSPEGRWYTQAEAVQMFQDVGFTDIQLFREFENTPASPNDRQFSLVGVKPAEPAR